MVKTMERQRSRSILLRPLLFLPRSAESMTEKLPPAGIPVETSIRKPLPLTYRGGETPPLLSQGAIAPGVVTSNRGGGGEIACWDCGADGFSWNAGSPCRRDLNGTRRKRAMKPAEGTKQRSRSILLRPPRFLRRSAERMTEGWTSRQRGFRWKLQSGSLCRRLTAAARRPRSFRRARLRRVLRIRTSAGAPGISNGPNECRRGLWEIFSELIEAEMGPVWRRVCLQGGGSSSSK